MCAAAAAAAVTTAAAVSQYLVGFGSYLWPTTPLEQRQALGPYHRFWGLAVYAAGMAAAAVRLAVEFPEGGGAHPPPAGHTQLSRVKSDCRGL
jgi:hypothetical protein